MTEKITQGNVLELWAKNYESVTLWLNHLQEKKLNAFSLYRFCQWAQKTPDQLLTEKSTNPSANTVEKLLDRFCNLDDERFTNSFQYQASIAVKSYFRWNYADLAKASGSVVLEKKKEYNKLSKEGLRKLWNRARNPRDRALIPLVCSTAIAKRTLSSLTWGLLEENWETKDLPAFDIPSKLLKGHGIGRYKGVRQITFLTPEAKRELVNYKEFIEQKLGRKVRSEEHIWLDLQTPYKPLEYDSFATLISRLTKEAGVKFTWHDARRWLTTAMEQAGLSPNWNRVLRGRKVPGSENPYSRPVIEQLRDKFREAVPLLEFINETPTLPADVQQKLADLEEAQRKLKAQYGIFRKSRGERKPRQEPDCEDGKHCETQRVVSEEELSKLLSEGWQVVTALASGSVVIRKS
jgi:SNF2 family DNA or RNA helicase